MILFCGDTFLKTKNNVAPFEYVNHYFKNFTVCINLETSLKTDVQVKKHVCLSISKNAVRNIPKAIKIISFVNNHVSDSGSPDELVQELKNAKRCVVGPNNPTKLSANINGSSVDFFSVFLGLPRLRLSYNGLKVDRLIKLLKQSTAQTKIVNMHWGYEHTTIPAPFQVKLARTLVDNGASLIIGHHPHVAQGWECYRNKYIFYSLGNFNFWQFDTKMTEKNRWGFMVKYDHINSTVNPIYYRINENYQPYIIDEIAKKNYDEKMKHLSIALPESDENTWFKEVYSGWYNRELTVWKKRCLNTSSFLLWIKFCIWLILPIQLRYYFIRFISSLRK